MRVTPSRDVCFPSRASRKGNRAWLLGRYKGRPLNVLAELVFFIPREPDDSVPIIHACLSWVYMQDTKKLQHAAVHSDCWLSGGFYRSHSLTVDQMLNIIKLSMFRGVVFSICVRPVLSRDTRLKLVSQAGISGLELTSKEKGGKNRLLIDNLKKSLSSDFASLSLQSSEFPIWAFGWICGIDIT